MKKKVIVGVITVGFVGVIGTVGAIAGYSYSKKPDLKIEETNFEGDNKLLNKEKIDSDLNYDDIIYKDGKVYFKKYVLILGKGDYSITVNDKNELVCRGSVIGKGVTISDKKFGDLSSVEVVENYEIYKVYPSDIALDPFIPKEITFEIKDGKEKIIEEKDISFKDFKNRKDNFNKVKAEYDVQQRISKVMKEFNREVLAIGIMRVHDSDGKYTFVKFYSDESRTMLTGYGVLNDETGEVYLNRTIDSNKNIVDIVLVDGKFYGVLSSGNIVLLNLSDWQIKYEREYKNILKGLKTRARYLGTSGDYIYLKYINGESESLVSFNTKTGEFSKAYKGENNNLHIEDVNDGYIIFSDGSGEKAKKIDIGHLNGNTIEIIKKDIEKLDKEKVIFNDEYIAVEKSKLKDGTKEVIGTELELYKLK
ncbi:hypothetical protein ACED96_11920 [Clostridium thermobutyricum]|uniref:hypothetical protein n=1 Tax=uncultured Clostridium sp. TaxID=59620 RepID=UPI0025879C9A|nr:hypothetical protein [uncultured Clostridium sp.]